VARHDFSEPLLAQRFVAGRHVAVEALFKNGRLLQYVCSDVLEDNHGPSTKRRYFLNDEHIGVVVAKMGHTAGLHGFANMALLQEAVTEDFCLFEADPRANKWVSYARWFGRDFAPAFAVFLADGEYDSPACLPATATNVTCWEVEYFASHLSKLVNTGRMVDALANLLSFDTHLRYMLYDPALLQAKMNDLRQQIMAQPGAAVANLVPPLVTCTVAARKPQSSRLAISKIRIDNMNYVLESLSPAAKEQLHILQTADQEIARLQTQLAIVQTARNAYAQALKMHLPPVAELAQSGGNLKIN
jgi:hypothetical protein